MAEKIIRAAIVGAGYIASWHAAAIRSLGNVRLTAICDVSKSAAEEFASAHGVPPYTSLEALLDAKVCDAVHILTPPNLHKHLAVTALRGGLHTLIEKPFALSRAEATSINLAARESGSVVAVGHNFLGIPSYLRLKEAVRSGAVGRISAAEFNWRFPLAPLRAGPYSLWMLRSPENILFELGPHLYAFAVDLFGTPTDFHVSVGQPIDLPTGIRHHQSWRILARAGDVDLTFNLSLVETFDNRSVSLYGSSGMATFDFASDTLVIRNENTAEIILNPLLRAASVAGQHLCAGMSNATRQLMSLNQRSPYAESFVGLADIFYGAIAGGHPVDARISGDSAEIVVAAIEDTIAQMPKSAMAVPASHVSKGVPTPTVLVIGGTGFIGRHLTRALVAAGRDVRVLSRGGSGLFSDLVDRVETISVSLKDEAGLHAAMRGIDAVYDLAKSVDNTWEGALENDVLVTKRIGEAAIRAGVKRFIYTGSIASYDMSDPTRTITEQTGFAPDMSDRNIYARSKAACEEVLERLHREQGLPLVIARPGIVVGEGGPLQHWGLGRWHGAGAVRIWGNGHNILPFVLIEDCSAALVRILELEDATGRSFNLVGEPMLTARNYLDAIHERLGARIRVRSGSLLAFYLVDTVKYALKRYVLRKAGASHASLRDWQSRAHLSAFDNSQSKRLLHWQPEADRSRFVDRAIVEANLLGF